MTAGVGNVAAYALQACALLGVGLVLPAAIGLREPRVGLRYWQALLCAILLLPLLQPWHHGRPPAGLPLLGATFANAVDALPAPRKDGIPWIGLFLAVLLGGAAVRLAWLAAGLFRLRSVRRGGRPLDPLPENLSGLRQLLGVRAEFLVSHAVGAPMTFGWRNPAILLPPGFRHLTPEVQAGVACHELLHVRRRDWLAVLAEDFARAVLWFHPAVWILVRRIGLCREQVVDCEAVRCTGDRRSYLEGLRTIALLQNQSDVRPSLLFLGRSQVVERVSLLAKEVEMSHHRLVAKTIVLAGALTVTAALGAALFPLVRGGGSGLFGVLAAGQPSGAGAFLVHVEVTGPTGTDSHYQFEVSVKDALSQELVYSPKIVVQGGEEAGCTSKDDKGRLFEIRVEAGKDGKEATYHLTVKQGDELLQDERGTVDIRPAGADAAVYGMNDKGIHPPEVVRQVSPIYPEEMAKAGKACKVVLSVLIDEKGDVSAARIVKSDDPGFEKSAEEAVRQWKFEPATLKGKPVRAEWTVSIRFIPEQ
jgi:TonB family protein